MFVLITLLLTQNQPSRKLKLSHAPIKLEIMIYVCLHRNLCSLHCKFTFLNLRFFISPVKTQLEIGNFKLKLLIPPTHSCARWRLCCWVSSVSCSSYVQIVFHVGGLGEEIAFHVVCRAEGYSDIYLLDFVCYKKYLTSRCLVRLLLEPFPFSVSSMVLLLSWYILVAVVMLMPCPFRKFCVHRICPIASSIATNSAYVELFVFSFCLHNVKYAAPFSSDMTIQCG